MQEVRAERFREDLYWRLNVVPIEIPPLRRRREDVPALVTYFLDFYNEVNDRYVAHIGSGVLEALQDYHWPGNVRELQNYIERAVVMAETDELTIELLPRCVTNRDALVGEELPVGDFESLAREVVTRGLNDAGTATDGAHSVIVDRVEKELIAQVLAACGGVQTKAANKLGINRNTLHKKIKEYGLDDGE
jgi:DNA-binding NtrC family response regulator